MNSVQKLALDLLNVVIVAFIVAGIVGFVVILQALMSRGASLYNAPLNQVFISAYFVDMTVLVAANAIRGGNGYV